MTSKKLSREDWVGAAMNVLATGGIDLVRVDRLAKDLEISRGRLKAQNPQKLHR